MGVLYLGLVFDRNKKSRWVSYVNPTYESLELTQPFNQIMRAIVGWVSKA